MSLKDNFNQAVKELLKRDGLVGSDLSKGAKGKSELDRYLDPPPQSTPLNVESLEDDIPMMPEGIVPVGETNPVKEAFPAREPVPSGAISGETSNIKETPLPVRTQPIVPSPMAVQAKTTAAGGNSQYGTGSQYSGNSQYGTSPQTLETPYFETEETTIISRNTIIDGNIRSFANINVEGSVKGDVQITKNANLSGKVVGDLQCNNANMLGSSMQGNVISKGQVKLDRDSLILGDIAAQYLDMNGKIKGNVEIGGKAEFKTDAIIFGNINASTITVLDGATIQGFVNTTFLQETAGNVFPDAVAVSE